ncbi:hypothetical protein E2C01_072964 [Portunus trituberculatus]|uniref:Uncharacterized protein n=1 Tax=Portunus trituberculatus TaxID=210409 RepID=A0A5B7IAD5_PORTR|nr:hypothetical protein [Portunus trituberculatus]
MQHEASAAHPKAHMRRPLLKTFIEQQACESHITIVRLVTSTTSSLTVQGLRRTEDRLRDSMYRRRDHGVHQTQLRFPSRVNTFGTLRR